MKLENVKLLMQQKVSLYCNEKNFISHGKLLAKAKRKSKIKCGNFYLQSKFIANDLLFCILYTYILSL